MAITTYAEYKRKFERFNYPFLKQAQNPNGLPLAACNITAPDAASAPTSAVLCDASTTGALILNPRLGAFTNPLYVAGMSWGHGSNNFMCPLLIDRIAHNGGLDGTVTTEQTTNLPTPSLGGISGVGMFIGIQVHTALGSTSVNVSARYTNSSGTANRTTKQAVIAASAGQSTFIILPLQDGDVGVNSVEGVTLTVSTGTAGNFGVVLFKMVAIFPPMSGQGYPMESHRDALVGGCGNLAPIRSNACLDILMMTNFSFAGFQGYVVVMEG